jgi:hypothetical protein
LADMSNLANPILSSLCSRRVCWRQRGWGGRHEPAPNLPACSLHRKKWQQCGDKGRTKLLRGAQCWYCQGPPRDCFPHSSCHCAALAARPRCYPRCSTNQVCCCTYSKVPVLPSCSYALGFVFSYCFFSLRPMLSVMPCPALLPIAATHKDRV